MLPVTRLVTRDGDPAACDADPDARYRCRHHVDPVGSRFIPGPVVDASGPVPSSRTTARPTVAEADRRQQWRHSPMRTHDHPTRAPAPAAPSGCRIRPTPTGRARGCSSARASLSDTGFVCMLLPGESATTAAMWSRLMPKADSPGTSRRATQLAQRRRERRAGLTRRRSPRAGRPGCARPPRSGPGPPTPGARVSRAVTLASMVCQRTAPQAMPCGMGSCAPSGLARPWTAPSPALARQMPDSSAAYAIWLRAAGAPGPAGSACQARRPSRTAARPERASASVSGVARCDVVGLQQLGERVEAVGGDERPWRASASRSGSTTASAGTSRSSRKERL